MKYINAEETAYRTLQRVLNKAMDGGQDEYSEDGQGPDHTKFKLPKRLRGWLFMERAQIPLKQHSGILNMTQGLNIDNLKKVMTESFPDKVLKDIDGRTATKAPWQQRNSSRKPFHKKRTFPTKPLEDTDEDDEDDDDAYVLDDYEDDEEWYGDEGDDDEDADDDQVA